MREKSTDKIPRRTGGMNWYPTRPDDSALHKSGDGGPTRKLKPQQISLLSQSLLKRMVQLKLVE